MKSKLLLLGLFISILLPSQVFSKDLIMTAPPRESVEKGQKIYAPVAAHLSKILGVKVTYVHPGNWLNYQREMRNDKYDVIFDGPHFVSWRMAHLGHKVVAKLPGHLQFALFTHVDSKKYNKPNDLVGRKICCISPPNLSTMSIIDNYRNPVRQPVIKGIKGGMGKVYKSFKKGMCDALVLRTAFYKKKLKDEDRKSIKRLYLTKKLPNQAISVSKRLSDNHVKLIANSLTIGKGVGSTKGILKRFGGKAKSFIPAKQEEFVGHNMLLEGVIFGW